MDGASATAPEVQEAERQIAHVPLVLNRRNFNWLTQRITGVVEQPAPRWWWVCFMTTASIATFGLFCIGYQISTGVGTWGNQIPVGWAWDITNFVFWIGIGHAGTLISAILFLLRQKWRTSINRSAEAMTLFAVICAAIFPGIHVGRSINAAGSLGAQRRIIRLRLDPHADVAHDYFSALLRRRRNLRRICDGADAALTCARDFQIAGRDHAAAHR